MSDATAAATRNSAGGGTGKNSVSLWARERRQERAGDDEDDQAEVGQLAHALTLAGVLPVEPRRLRREAGRT